MIKKFNYKFASKPLCAFFNGFIKKGKVLNFEKLALLFKKIYQVFWVFKILVNIKKLIPMLKIIYKKRGKSHMALPAFKKFKNKYRHALVWFRRSVFERKNLNKFFFEKIFEELQLLDKNQGKSFDFFLDFHKKALANKDYIFFLYQGKKKSFKKRF